MWQQHKIHKLFADQSEGRIMTYLAHRKVKVLKYSAVIITYLVSCRRSIEIWRVCKIYGRRGGAEPSIYFTNPPYFYRPSATDQISVLFRRGPWIMYVVAKIGKKSKHTSYIYGRFLRAKMWRYDLRGRRHRLRYENKGRNDVVPLLKSMKKSTLVRC